MRPLILLSNDDGVASPGLHEMKRALGRWGSVIVCAPELNQSATGHALSLNRPLRIRRAAPDVFAVDGTPADCVYVALHSGTRVLPRFPDLVVSGMNNGMNLGIDVFYSGTVAAAREAAFQGLPGVAVSTHLKADPKAAAALASQVAKTFLGLAKKSPTKSRTNGPLLNINIPVGNAWPVEVTVLGRRLYDQRVHYRTDPRGGEYLWIGGARVSHVPHDGSDTDAYDRGVVSLTPLSLDNHDRERESLMGDLLQKLQRALGPGVAAPVPRLTARRRSLKRKP